MKTLFAKIGPLAFLLIDNIPEVDEPETAKRVARDLTQGALFSGIEDINTLILIPNIESLPVFPQVLARQYLQMGIPYVYVGKVSELLFIPPSEDAHVQRIPFRGTDCTGDRLIIAGTALKAVARLNPIGEFQEKAEQVLINCLFKSYQDALAEYDKALDLISRDLLMNGPRGFGWKINEN